MPDEVIKKTVIVEDEALKHGFTQLPNYVLKNPKLTFGARLTYAVAAGQGCARAGRPSPSAIADFPPLSA